MLNLLKNESNMTTTENGAAAYRTSGSCCLDLFASIGGLRHASHASEEAVVSRFVKAYAEDPLTALKIAFFARDIRGGLGERRVFRIIINYLALSNPEVVIKNIKNIPEYGRFDDLYALMGTSCEDYVFDFIAKQLRDDVTACDEDKGTISLLAKWLPSVNASNAETVFFAKKTAKKLGMNDAQYRKTLSKLRKYIDIIENRLREKDYTFDYSKQPSKAMYKYKSAFVRNDGERYKEFLQSVQRGDAKLNTGTLYPYEIVRGCFNANMSEQEKNILNVTWNNITANLNAQNAIAVVDGSGSMYSGRDIRPIDIALSLGIFFAERNEGEFKNHFITFSQNPQLVEIKGDTVTEKVRYCESFNEAANTNFQKVFELILNTAVKHKVPQKQMPGTIYIISDMEFDYCTQDANSTIFEYAKKLYGKYSYALPNVVFWNVESRNKQVPVEKNEQGVSLVSGASPKIFEMAVSGNMNPYKFMEQIITSERYKKIII